MQQISTEFLELIHNNLKIGPQAKPTCRVEIDRQTFVPGRVERLNFDTYEMEEVTRIEQRWIPPRVEVIDLDDPYENLDPSNLSPDHSSSSTISSARITFPLSGYTHDHSNVWLNRPYGSNGHKGVDFVLRDGSVFGHPIVAIHHGTVEKVLNAPTSTTSWGSYVLINHHNGYKSRYAHLKDINVSQGQKVSQGQRIGTVGATGHVRSQWANGGAGGNPTQAERARGIGAHLHFEILRNGNYVNPTPFIRGTSKFPDNATGGPTDGSQTGTTVRSDGFIRNTLWEQNFTRDDWHRTSSFNIGDNFSEWVRYERDSNVTGRWMTFDFQGARARNAATVNGRKVGLRVRFEINVHTRNSCRLSFNMRSNFNNDLQSITRVKHKPDNDQVTIWVGNSDDAAAVYTKFDGLGSVKRVNDLVIPAGSTMRKVIIEVRFGGENFVGSTGNYAVGSHGSKIFSISEMRLVEVAPAPMPDRDEFGGPSRTRKPVEPVEEPTDDPNLPIDPTVTVTETVGYYEDVEVTEFIMNKVTESVDIEVGEFVYRDTIILDNVEAVDVDYSMDQDCAGASVTMTNIDGFYSQDYNPYYFPELKLKMDSPFTDYAGGFRLGVISNNAPVRVYMGYGDHSIRVFTGLIDKVDMIAETSTLTFTARDMYKKAIDKVLTETKQYPEISLGDDSGVDPDGYIENEVIDAPEDYTPPPSSPAPSPPEVPDDAILVARVNVYMDSQFISESDFLINGKTSENVTINLSVSGGTVAAVTGGEHVSGNLYSLPANWIDRVTIDDSTDPVKAVHKMQIYYSTRAFPDINPDGSGYGGPDLDDYFEDWENITAEEIADSAWLKTAVVHDLIDHAGLLGWRQTAEDQLYPDIVIEESYMIQVNPAEGTVVKAVPGVEGEFETVPIESLDTPEGYKNPFVEAIGRKFEAYKIKVAEAIVEVLKDTNYRIYCDRFGTVRVHPIRFNEPTVAMFTNNNNISMLSKNIDFSRTRSHIVVWGKEGQVPSNFVDKEILLEINSELRTATASIDWADTEESKKMIAERLFMDMKRLARTLSVSIPGHPALDLMDRIQVTDSNTATFDEYIIKGIRHAFNVNNGYVTELDVFWAGEDVVE